MKKSLLIIILQIFVSSQCFSQSIFQQVYKNDSLVFGIKHVAMTYDNGFIMSGAVSDYQLFGGGPGDVLMIRTDSSGNVLWSRRWDFGEDESVFSVLATNDNCYLVTGFTFGASTNGRDAFLLKADDNGNLVWVKRIDHTGTNTFHSIRSAEPNRYILSGRSDGGAGGQYDMYMCLSDTAGNMLWGHTYGGGDWDWGWWAEQTTDFGFIMTGESQSFGIGSNDIYLVKTDSAGNKLWSRAYGSTSFEKGLWVQQISGHYYVAGYTQGLVPGNSDAKTFLMKTDLSGNVVWFKIYKELETPDAISQTTDGGFIMIGGGYNLPGAFGGFDVYVIKTDSAGNVQWSHAYGGTNADAGTHINQLQDGYLIGGVTYNFASSQFSKAYLIKTDSIGYSGCNDVAATTTVYTATPTMIIPPDLEFSGVTSNLPPVTTSSPVIIRHGLCPIVSIEENESPDDNNFSIYPNPAGSILTISKVKAGQLIIVNLIGEAVYAQNILSNNDEILELDISSLTPGIYFIRTGNEVRKFIKG